MTFFRCQHLEEHAFRDEKPCEVNAAERSSCTCHLLMEGKYASRNCIPEHCPKVRIIDVHAVNPETAASCLIALAPHGQRVRCSTSCTVKVMYKISKVTMSCLLAEQADVF